MSEALGSLMSSLPMPEGQPILEKLTTLPSLFASAVVNTTTNEAGDYLLDPHRFRAALEPASAGDLELILPMLLGQRAGESEEGVPQKWSLAKNTVRNQAIAMALLESTNAGLRATALHALGKHVDDASLYLKAISDSNVWVRAEAIKQFVLTQPGRARLEEVIGPLLADTNPPIASAAVLSLLEPEIAKAAGVSGGLNSFEFGATRFDRTYDMDIEQDMPLSTLETKPAYLTYAKTRLTQSKSSGDQLLLLLLAQHADFSALEDWIAKHPPSTREGDVDTVVLTAISLSHDNKFIPYLSALAQVNKNQYYLRTLLRALKGMTGSERRQLRLDINKQMRTSTN
jgi:hypothetical protein